MLNLEQFVAEETERYHSLKKILTTRKCASNEQKDQRTHNQGRPCAYLTKVPEPSDKRKQIIIEKGTSPVKAAPLIRGPSAIPMEERFWRPIPKAEEIWISSKATFEESTESSSTRTSSSRTGRTVYRPKLRQRMVEESLYVQFWNFDTWVEMLTR